MSKTSLLGRLSQPRSLAAIFAVIMAFIAVTAIPAEARRHGYRGYHYSAHRHVYHRYFTHYRGYRRVARRHYFPRVNYAGGADAGVIGEHHGFSAIVVDANSGRTLYGRAEHELRHPASVTKVMTLYLLFEQLERGKLRLDTPLMVSQHAAAQAPSKLGLAPGESISVENAIKAVVTKSANDIACAIAENVAGDEHTFAQMMTRKAHALGMRNTHYENASGLPNAEQVTTAYDLAVLGRAIQDRFPRYYRYFSTHSFAYNGALHRNHNHLLGQVEGMDGIKTGYTRASGFNLLTSVRRGGHHIVAVVMGGRTGYARDRAMAGLIEQHIGGGASVRTAAAISEESAAPQQIAEAEPEIVEQPIEQIVERPVPERERVGATRRLAQRLAYAEEDMDGADEFLPAPLPPPQRRESVAAAPEPVRASAPVAAREKRGSDAAPPVRPAFVSGMQRKVADELPEPKKSARGKGKSDAALASLDGSTTSRVTRTREISVSTATPSSIRGASKDARADAARPTRPGWMIQIGATDDADKANQLLSRARGLLQGFPSTAKAFTEKVQKGNETLYRARFAGLEEESAASACKALKRSGFACFTTKN